MQPSIPKSAKQVRGAAWIVGILGLVGCTVLYFAPPAGQIFYPRCQLLLLTGIWCPGCGGMRAIHHLLHGRFGEAYQLNALFVLAVPAMLLGLSDLLKRNSAARWWHRMEFWMLMAGAITGFGLSRNLPGWHP